MRKLVSLSVMLVFVCTVNLYSESKTVLKGFRVTRFPFYIYKDLRNRMNNGVLTGWMGDFQNLKIEMGWGENPKTGETCIRLTYAPDKNNRVNWAGLALQQNPENYWGSLRGGYDLTRAKRVFFYARGEKGGEVVEFKMGRHKKQYEKNTKGTTGLIRLTNEWKLYELNIEQMTLNDIAGGFCFIIAGQKSVETRTIFLDDIYFSDSVQPISHKNEPANHWFGKK